MLSDLVIVINNILLRKNEQCGIEQSCVPAGVPVEVRVCAH